MSVFDQSSRPEQNIWSTQPNPESPVTSLINPPPLATAAQDPPGDNGKQTAEAAAATASLMAHWATPERPGPGNPRAGRAHPSADSVFGTGSGGEKALGFSCTPDHPTRGKEAETADTQPIFNALSRGSLVASQVSLPPLRQELAMNEVSALAAKLQGVGNPGGRPLQDAVRAGRATVGKEGVQLAALPTTSTGAGLGDAVAALRPRDVRLVIQDGQRYSVQAQLNPWIQVANGIITACDDTGTCQ